MNEEELKAKAEELEKKAEELERKGSELQKKEDELKAHEEELSRHEADAGKLAAQVKEEFEKKLTAQKADFEKRLIQREEVIKQLSAGEQSHPAPSFIDRMNEKREMQNKKW